MNILQRYLTKKLIVNFTGAIFLFIVLFIFSKLSEQMNHFVKIANKTPFIDFIMYFIYEIPYTALYVLPMSTLFSVVYVLGKLNEAHELYIFQTTGKSIWYYMAPFILFLFILCSTIAVFNEEILFIPHQKHRTLHKKFRDQVYAEENDRKNIIQFGTDNKLYIVNLYKVKDKSLNKVKIFYLDENNKFKKIMVADKLKFQTNSTWNISSFRQFDLKKEKISYSLNKPREINLGDKLFYFKSVFHSPEDLSTQQIKEEIQKIKTIGGNNNQLLTEYYFKIASPYISLILVFLGIPLSTFSRQSVTISSFFFVIMTAFLYMVFFNIGISLGKSGIINPFIGGWLGNIAFAITSIFLNIFVKKN